ncbi:MAG: 2-oxo acid dehydrogenase subunit E2, partial [Nocardioidaceae bacterium]
MAESSHDAPLDNPLSAFGANEWLVDEMYERYQQDPNSVDKAWLAFFKDYQPDSTSSATNGGATKAAPSSAPPSSPAKAAPAKPAQQPAQAAPAPAAAKKATTPAKTASPSSSAADKSSDATPRPDGTPSQPAARTTSPTPKEPKESAKSEASDEPTLTVMRGAPARTAQNMDASLAVPTATSVRSVPVKLLIDNRTVINNHLARARGGKVSFTHLIGFALVKALRTMPEMNVGFDVIDGKPNLISPAHVNLGLAIDLPKPDGTRQLVVPSIKAAENMDFAAFWGAYEEVVRKARNNKLTVADFQGTSISLTNPGTIGTNHSVPRLMKGQGAIIGVGSMDYPPEYQGASDETLTRNAVSKVMTLTSTYDHRVIQGAQSGEFLRRIHSLLLGEEDFYDEIFRALRIPYEPIRWAKDISTSHDDEISKQARILELIHSYRVRGHMMADTDPLEYQQRSHPDLEVESHGLTLWDLDREFATGSFGGEGRRFMKLRNILGILRDSYCRTVGIEYMHIQDPEQRRWIQQRVEQPHVKPPREEQLRILLKLNQAEAFETFLQTKFVGQKRFSLEGGESVIPMLDAVLQGSATAGLD